MGNSNHKNIVLTKSYDSLKIIKIYESSPLYNLLEEEIDYIIGIENYISCNILKDFNKILFDNIDNPIKLITYNIINNKIKTVTFKPQASYSRNIMDIIYVFSNIEDDKNKIMRIESNKNIKNETFNIFDFIIGLKNYDYISLEDLDTYFKIKKSGVLLVYNIKDNQLRKIEIDFDKNIINKNILGFTILQGIKNNIYNVINDLNN